MRVAHSTSDVNWLMLHFETFCRLADIEVSYQHLSCFTRLETVSECQALKLHQGQLICEYLVLSVSGAIDDSSSRCSGCNNWVQQILWWFCLHDGKRQLLLVAPLSNKSEYNLTKECLIAVFPEKLQMDWHNSIHGTPGFPGLMSPQLCKPVY